MPIYQTSTFDFFPSASRDILLMPFIQDIQFIWPLSSIQHFICRHHVANTFITLSPSLGISSYWYSNLQIIYYEVNACMISFNIYLLKFLNFGCYVLCLLRVFWSELMQSIELKKVLLRNQEQNNCITFLWNTIVIPSQKSNIHNLHTLHISLLCVSTNKKLFQYKRPSESFNL